MKWFLRLSAGFLALAMVLFSFVYFLTSTQQSKDSEGQPETESATTAPPADKPEQRTHDTHEE